MSSRALGLLNKLKAAFKVFSVTVVSSKMARLHAAKLSCEYNNDSQWNILIIYVTQ